MSPVRGHRAETGMLADAFDVHVRPDRKHSPGQPCAAALATGESVRDPGRRVRSAMRAPAGSDGRAA
jgi:hypothetical protein